MARIKQKMLNPVQEEFENPTEKFGLPDYRRKDRMELRY
jgi:hypothetical protein